MSLIPSPLKETLKRWRHSASQAYVNRFFAFTPAQFADLLQHVGVRPGDVICVHSSFDSFAGFRGNVGDVLSVLQQAVGADGGLIMPTQPFTTTAIDYVRKTPVTDLGRAPSLMGIMTEILRRTKGAVRSINPTHPVAAWGEKATALLGRDWEAGTPCGQGTVYQRLLDTDAKILMLGTGLQPVTFYHYTEEVIEPLMPFSPFTTEVFTLQTRDRAGALYTSRMRLFEPAVSSRRRMSLLEPTLREKGWLRTGKVGRLRVIVLRPIQVLEAVQAMAKQGRFCYLPPGRA